MKVLITGSNGMLGKAVINEFKEEDLICTDIEELDITDNIKVNEFIKEKKPDYVINCAAYTAVDKAEDNQEIANKINVIGVKNLAIAANLNDAVLIHISTDYVFDGEKSLENVYIEDDVPNPKSVYGKTKLKSEVEIKKNCSKFYIFRTSWLFGDGNNFVRTMIKLGKKQDEVSVVNDQYGTPTYAVDLAKIIKQSIEKNIQYGLYHATNLGYTTWSNFTREIFENENIDCKVKEITSKELIRKAKRPTNSKLSKQKLLELGITIPNYLDALKRYLKEENNLNE